MELSADEGAELHEYDAIETTRLTNLKYACPSTPGNVVPVREVAGIKVDQVIVGRSGTLPFGSHGMAKKCEGRMFTPKLLLCEPRSRPSFGNVA